MKPSRVVALIVGCLLILPGVATLLGGGGLALAHIFARDDQGYYDITLDRLATSTVAVSAENVALGASPGSFDWLVDALDADVRLRVSGASAKRDLFVGIGPEADVDSYLAGVAHDEIVDVRNDRSPVYRARSGRAEIPEPEAQSFWVASASGAGPQELTWRAATGRWAVVVMNADGSPGVVADVNAGVKVGFLFPLALLLVVAGALLVVVGVVAILLAGLGGAHQAVAPQAVPTAVLPVSGAELTASSPVTVTARLDERLSRWQWLVKWFLAIPHFVALAFLWVAFSVLTVIAGFSILFTGRYPRGIFNFNVGVLRWSWRVSYYATSGGVGTDRYPPFSLADDASYPARLDVVYPARLSRGLVLVKWWLLAIPHYLIVGLLMGGSFGWVGGIGDDQRFNGGGGLLGLLVLIAGVILLITGLYPPRLFELIIGLNRWVYRVVAYAALMTDRYPPFRLDQGGDEPTPITPAPPATPGFGAASEERPAEGVNA